ncbi:MAG TPA: type II toxin-antitoxin system HipA family toxin, partial [Candidatus Nesterenkonia stercoripullorum]|nr:type II toxin-antitoxin system HipA family toxin [Candidatus Nesterenkonia stercoripullorum]
MDATKVGEAETVETSTRQRRLVFTYDRGWLSTPDAFPISPEMPLTSGPHEPFPSRHTPLAFDDAAPDRWGRDLINAGHRRQAKESGQLWRPLDEVGLLLAVNDETRQGALRFRLDGHFLSQPQERARMHELADLRAAAALFEQSGEIDESVEHLIAVGSSPGGAVPKAWVHDEADRMWLAKFPRASDLADVGAWEQVAMMLQRRAGIAVQPSQILRLGNSESVFLAQRFDREGERRLPYQSFKTMFMLDDGERKDYASLSREVTRISANPKADGEQLFARAAFGVMVNNIDDHMRNHGLLRRGPGWRLAPSFDVNPSARGFSDTPLTPEDDPANPDLRLLVERAEDFHMTQDGAAQRLKHVANAVEAWADVARETGIDPETLRSMSTAFDESHRETAKRISGTKGTSQKGDQRGLSGQVWIKPHV